MDSHLKLILLEVATFSKFVVGAICMILSSLIELDPSLHVYYR